MTIPSFLLFFCLSKYKNSRFLVTFCFVDTVTFIIAAIGKLGLILGGGYGGILSCLLLLALSLTTFLVLRPYYAEYRNLMEQVSTGWAPMAVSTVFIYILLILSTAFPLPLLQRTEYIPVFLLLCVTILSFYAVFIILIIQKGKLTRANLLLQQQRHWQELAYMDELTHLANLAAYSARTHELETEAIHDREYFLLVFDIDEFKAVNDTYGHLEGNEVLKKTANFFLNAFPGANYEFFRIGGDEFAAIASGVMEYEVQDKVRRINTMPKTDKLGCTYSCGYAPVDFGREKAFEQAFVHADEIMYACKSRKKQHTSL